jgi:predicted permease
MMSDAGRRPPFRLSLGAKHLVRDVDQEIEFHLAMRTQALIATGLDPEIARAQAAAQFGDSAGVRDECITIDTRRTRAMTASEHLDNLRRDAAYAIRTLRQHPGFAVVVVLILALGIGANTATFSVIDALMLRLLPVDHPGRLVTIGDPAFTGSVVSGSPRADIASYPLYLDLRDGNHVLAGLYAAGLITELDVIADQRPGARGGTPAETEHPRGRLVSANFFSVLGVRASAGRTFAATEGRVVGADPVVVISHAYWRQRFASDPAVVGHSITINGAPFVIIGIAEPGFTGDIVGEPQDLWVPITMEAVLTPNDRWLTERHMSWLQLMGRLAPGVSLAQARAAITVLETQSLLDHATGQDLGGIKRRLRERPPRIESGARGFSYYRASLAPAMYTLTAAVGLVLIVVCANVANLMLARAAARSREISVRIALGAGRLRLVQQLVTESALLAGVGAVAGLVVAWWGRTALLRLAVAGPEPLPVEVHFNAPVLAFTAALSVGSALLVGLVPALRATRADVATALRTHGRDGGGASSKPGRFPLGKGLVVAQVALSMLLLVGTGMLVRTTQRLEHADVGVARDRLIIASVDTKLSDYTGPGPTALMRDLLKRVAAVPGVEAVSLSQNGIFSGNELATTLQVEGYTARADSDTVVAEDNVGPRYFNTVAAHLLRGRDVEEQDNETAPKVVVLNETMARYYFPHGDALGHHITADSASWEIVGIVADVQNSDVRGPPDRRAYFPIVQHRPRGTFKIEVRTGGDPAKLIMPVRQTLTAADPTLVITDIDPLSDLIRDSVAEDRLVASAVSFFGALALVLSALGLYGLMAYATTRRTAEFGLRMALGAEPGIVSRMVLGEAMTLATAGIAIGLPVALATAQLIRGRLFEIGVFDPPSIGIAVVVLAVSAAIAAYVPAIRASSVEPLAAIRAN